MTTSSCFSQSIYPYKTKLDQPQVPLFSFGNTPSSSPDDIIKNLLSPSKEDGFSILAGLRRANTSPSPTRRRESREAPINIAPTGKEKESLEVSRSEQLSKEKDVVLPDRNASVSAEGSRGDYIRASISNQDPQSNDALNSGVSLSSQLSENTVQEQPLELIELVRPRRRCCARPGFSATISRLRTRWRRPVGRRVRARRRAVGFGARHRGEPSLSQAFIALLEHFSATLVHARKRKCKSILAVEDPQYFLPDQTIDHGQVRLLPI